MEKDATQSKPSPTISNPPAPSKSPNPSSVPPIPSLDLKAPLKIEEQTNNDPPKVDYEKNLFLAGVVFCVIIIVSIIVITYFWMQTGNQTQKTITIQQSN